ncbi:ROK family transcriptional regulator [Symbiobacterium thermophilum]|uniref:Transcriptional repressor n=1 Tax=Symbiobacterium thermophilum (strain DSM 24528 / JCM 14929 / IAM 14863 / T) TaxID=292459 RepID=Q67NW4_SYMTH|nr:ROK family transcriptional regulator [Symbiobacterium thermophilum]BAD40629.1 transcriptional repressor [Symbiobacterium thermophilum IAM 14863]
MLVGPELIRAINKQRVLRLVRSAGAMSRADLAERTGLTRPTVSAVVAELLEEGWVEEIGTGESSGGRPPILLRFNPRARWVIGAELGAGHVRAVLADLAGNVFHRFKQRVESRDPLIEVDQLERAVRYLLDQTPRYGPPTPVAGVGIGITGVIDPEEGVWRYSPHYQVRDLPVAPMLQERLSLPVWIENDARAMAWGERSFGAAQGVDNLAFIRVGVGLGAGIIIDGRLYGGAHQGAGEIGHIMVKERGLRCRCGSDGCLETVGSAIAIARRAVQRMAQGEETLIRELCGGDPSKVIATTVIEAADAGDRVAQEILSEAGRFLGIGIGAMINLLNPAMVIIGGGTSRAGDYLIEPLRQAALERTLPALRERVKIVRTELGEDAGPLGGAALVIEELFRTPTLK